MLAEKFYKLKIEPEEDDPSKDWYFYIKTLDFKSISTVFWEYSCGCSIKLSKDCSDAFLRYGGPMWLSFEAEKISEANSFWAKDDSPPTSHVYCPVVLPSSTGQYNPSFSALYNGTSISSFEIPDSSHTAWFILHLPLMAERRLPKALRVQFKFPRR